MISDLYELVPEIKSYIGHMIVADSLQFLSSYLTSVDPKTVISTVKFVTNIIMDFSTESSGTFEGSECEKKMKVQDLRNIYNCAVTQLGVYCEMRSGKYLERTDSKQTVHPVVRSASARNVLKDRTNVQTIEITEKNKKTENMSMLICENAGDSSVEIKARKILFTPLIATVTGLIDSCLTAVSALSLGDQKVFFGVGISGPKSTIDSVSVLLSSLCALFEDLILLGWTLDPETLQSSGGFDERRERFEGNERGIKSDRIQSGSERNEGEGSEGVFRGLLWRRRKAIFEIFSALSLMPDEYILSTKSTEEYQNENQYQNHKNTGNGMNKNMTEYEKKSFQTIQDFYSQIGNSLKKFSKMSGFLDTFFAIVEWGCVSPEDVTMKNEKDTVRSSSDEIPEYSVGEKDEKKAKVTVMLQRIYTEMLTFFPCQRGHKGKDLERGAPIDIDADNDEMTGKMARRQSQSIRRKEKNIDCGKIKSKLKNNDTDREMNSGNIQCTEYSNDSVEDSQNSRILTLACLGPTTSNSTINLDLGETSNNNNSAPVKTNPNARFSKKSVARNYDSTCATPGGKMVCASLSKAFTPAHSKSRRIEDSDMDSQDNSDIKNSDEKMISSGNNQKENIENDNNESGSVRMFVESQGDSPVPGRSDRGGECRGFCGGYDGSYGQIGEREEQDEVEIEAASWVAGGVMGMSIDEDSVIGPEKEAEEEVEQVSDTDTNIEGESESVMGESTGSRSQSQPDLTHIPSQQSILLSVRPTPALGPALALATSQTLASAFALRQTLSNAVPAVQTLTPHSVQSGPQSYNGRPLPLSDRDRDRDHPLGRGPTRTPTPTPVCPLIDDVTSAVTASDAFSSSESRVENADLHSRLCAANCEILSVRAENVQLKCIRDSLLTDRLALRSLSESLTVELAGNSSRALTRSNIFVFDRILFIFTIAATTQQSNQHRTRVVYVL
jgi:hypothetical protein